MINKAVFLIMIICNGLNGVFMLMLGNKIIAILCLIAMIYATYGLIKINSDE